MYYALIFLIFVRKEPGLETQSYLWSLEMLSSSWMFMLAHFQVKYFKPLDLLPIWGFWALWVSLPYQRLLNIIHMLVWSLDRKLVVLYPRFCSSNHLSGLSQSSYFLRHASYSDYGTSRFSSHFVGGDQRYGEMNKHTPFHIAGKRLSSGWYQ